MHVHYPTRHNRNTISYPTVRRNRFLQSDAVPHPLQEFRREPATGKAVGFSVSSITARAVVKRTPRAEPEQIRVGLVTIRRPVRPVPV
jgi:hypothetical protein